MQDFEASPAALRLITSASNVALANPEAQVFSAMIDGWRNQQLSRGLREQTIRNWTATVTRFRDFVDKPPWRWTVADVDEFTAQSGGRTRTLSTMRANHGSIRGFCDYLTNPLYDWMEICDREFGEVPSQVCLPWNTVAHRFEFEGDGKRRPFTYDEIERLFDTADARVELLVSSGRKGALGALRDAQLLKTVYAFGLRRTEAVMLDTVDLHHNAKMRQWGALRRGSRAMGEGGGRWRATTSHGAAGAGVRLVGARNAAMARAGPGPFRARRPPRRALGDRAPYASVCWVSRPEVRRAA